MKWFKHMTDSHTNIKHRDILLDLGLEGYAVYWICLELVGQQGVKFRLNSNKSWKNVLKDITKLSDEKLDKILNKFSEVNLICRKSLLKDELYIPKMAERADEYSVRISRHTTDTLLIDKNRLDQIRREYTKAVGWDEATLVPSDYGRLHGAIKRLVKRANGADAMVVEAIHWIAGKPFSWTLETLDRLWPEFMKERHKPESEYDRKLKELQEKKSGKSDTTRAS